MATESTISAGEMASRYEFEMCQEIVSTKTQITVLKVMQFRAVDSLNQFFGTGPLFAIG